MYWRVTLLSTLALAVPLSAVAAGTAYKWVDPDGVTHYGERPPADRPARALALAPSPPPADPPDYRAILEQAERLEQARLDRERARAAAERERREAALLAAQHEAALARDRAVEGPRYGVPYGFLHPWAPHLKPPHIHPPLPWKPGRHDAKHRTTHDAPLHGQRGHRAKAPERRWRDSWHGAVPFAEGRPPGSMRRQGRARPHPGIDR